MVSCQWYGDLQCRLHSSVVELMCIHAGVHTVQDSIVCGAVLPCIHTWLHVLNKDAAAWVCADVQHLEVDLHRHQVLLVGLQQVRE